MGLGIAVMNALFYLVWSRILYSRIEDLLFEVFLFFASSDPAYTYFMLADILLCIVSCSLGVLEAFHTFEMILNQWKVLVYVV